MQLFIFIFLARDKKKQRRGDPLEVFEGHEDGINCLAIAADESVLVSGSEDCTVRIWDLEDETPITPPPGINQVNNPYNWMN